MGNDQSDTRVAPDPQLSPSGAGNAGWSEARDGDVGGTPGGGASGARQVRWGSDTEHGGTGGGGFGAQQPQQPHQQYGGSQPHHQYSGSQQQAYRSPQQSTYAYDQQQQQAGYGSGGYVSDGGSYYAQPPAGSAGASWGGGAYQSSPQQQQQQQQQQQGGYYQQHQQPQPAAAAAAQVQPIDPAVVKKVTAFVFKLLPNYGAIEARDTLVMQAIASDQVDVRARDKKGNTLLLLAAKAGLGPVIQVLVQRGVSMGDQNMAGHSALHYACCGGVMGDALAGESAIGAGGYGGRTDIARLLLESGVPPQLTDKTGFTALHSAVCYGGDEDVALVELLLKFGAGVTLGAADNSGYTAIEWAKHEDKAEIVRMLMAEAGASAVMIVATPTPAGGLGKSMDYGLSDDDEDGDERGDGGGSGGNAESKQKNSSVKPIPDADGLVWEKHFDDESEMWFEYCERTGESRWIEEEAVAPGTPKSPGSLSSKVHTPSPTGARGRSTSPFALPPKTSIAMLAKAKLNMRAKRDKARKSIIAAAIASATTSEEISEVKTSASMKSMMKGALDMSMINEGVDGEIARATHLLAARDKGNRGGGAVPDNGPPPGMPPGAAAASANAAAAARAALAALSPTSRAGIFAAESRAAEHGAARDEREAAARELLSPQVSASKVNAATKTQEEAHNERYRKSLMRLWRSSARSVGAKVVRERKVRLARAALHAKAADIKRIGKEKSLLLSAHKDRASNLEADFRASDEALAAARVKAEAQAIASKKLTDQLAAAVEAQNASVAEAAALKAANEAEVASAATKLAAAEAKHQELIAAAGAKRSEEASAAIAAAEAEAAAAIAQHAEATSSVAALTAQLEEEAQRSASATAAAATAAKMRQVGEKLSRKALRSKMKQHADFKEKVMARVVALETELHQKGIELQAQLKAAKVNEADAVAREENFKRSSAARAAQAAAEAVDATLASVAASAPRVASPTTANALARARAEANERAAALKQARADVASEAEAAKRLTEANGSLSRSLVAMKASMSKRTTALETQLLIKEREQIAKQSEMAARHRSLESTLALLQADGE